MPRRDVHTLRLVMLSKPEYNHNLTVIQRYEKKNSAQLTVVTEHFKTSRKMHMLKKHLCVIVLAVNRWGRCLVDCALQQKQHNLVTMALPYLKMDLKSDFFYFFQTICFWKAHTECLVKRSFESHLKVNNLQMTFK